MQNPPVSLQDPRARIVTLSRERGVSLSGLSQLIGRNPSYLQQFIRKGSPRKLDEKDRRTLAQFFGVSEAELVDPKEKPFVNSRMMLEQPVAQENAEAISPPGLAKRLNPERGRSSRGDLAEDFIEVPRLNVQASAGSGAVNYGESAFDAFRFSSRWIREQGFEAGQLSIIKVEGDSMEPLLHEGDEILVDHTPRAFRDGVHVVRLGDTLMVKRVASAGAGRFSLLSQNPAYPPVTLPYGDFEIIGRVVWKGGRI